MTDVDLTALAALLNQKDNDPTAALKLRRGVVTAVSTTSATITVGGVSITGVPFYSGLNLVAGSVVDVLFDGPAPRIIGLVGGGGSTGGASLPASQLFTATINSAAPAAYNAWYDFFTQNSVAVVPVACTMDVEVVFWTGFTPSANFLQLRVVDETDTNITHGMPALNVSQPASQYIPGSLRGSKTYAAGATAGFRLAWNLSAASMYFNGSVKVSFRL